MTRYIVDASVAVKWYLPEEHRAAALSIIRPDASLYAPNFIELEFANALAKKVRRGELGGNRAFGYVLHLRTLPMTFHPLRSLVPSAMDLALQTTGTVYDCLYLALAHRLRGRMVTADKRFKDLLAPTVYANDVIWLGDMPVAT